MNTMRTEATMGYVTIADAVADMSDRLGLEREKVRDALRLIRGEFGRWEDLIGDELDRVLRLVWSEATDGAAWPF